MSPPQVHLLALGFCHGICKVTSGSKICSSNEESSLNRCVHPRSLVMGCGCRQVAAAAHALVLASGTLAPVAALTAQLFPAAAPADITHFSCGHVVDPRRLVALALGARPPPPRPIAALLPAPPRMS